MNRTKKPETLQPELSVMHNHKLMQVISNHWFYSVLFLSLCLTSQLIKAQVPQIDPISDASGFPGTSECSVVSLTNSGPPGYGPYLRVIIPADVTLDSASLFNNAISVSTVGTFPPPPGNQLTDPNTGEVIMGNEGDILYIIEPPVGSVVDGGIPLDIEICYTIDPNAPVNINVPIQVTPVYEFGNSPTGDNGPITGTTINFNVTPILIEFEKSNSAPEGERPPGNDWPVTYTIAARIAANNTVENIAINDILPTGFVLDVPSINTSPGCIINSNNPLNVSCASINGTNGNDVLITYSGYFDDILDESNCTSQNLTNNVTLDADFMGLAIPQESDSSDVSVEHFSIQKSSDIDTASPGDTVTFTLTMQLSEFATSDAMTVQDTLDDGYTFVGGSESSSLGSITASANEVNGVTTLDFDLLATNGGNISGGAPTITVSYQATVDQTYFNNSPVLASDALNNQIISTYNLLGGATACTETSSNTVNIAPVQISKDIVAPQAFYEPGDLVTYRLTLLVPSGDTNTVVFTDYLPLPVLDATTINTTFGTDIVLSPIDTLGLSPTSIMTNASSNSVAITWPNISTTSPQVLSVDLSVAITTDPFADNLNLSNILAVSSENSDTTTVTNVTPVSIQVRAPELTITKGVLSADQGTITPAASQLPVDGNLIDADSNDLVSFQITVENLGGASAFDVVITDPAVAGLVGCVTSSVEDGTGATLATTGSIETGLTLNNPLAANDGTLGAPYADDTVLITLNCNLANNLEFGGLITNTAEVVFAGAGGGLPYPVLSDDATITLNSPEIEKSIISISPNVDGVNNTITVGEIITYQVVLTLPEGIASNAEIIDRLDNGLLINSVTSISPSAGVSTSDPGGFPAVLTGASGVGTRDLVLDFATITATSTGETITIIYDVLVNDAGVIVDGLNRNNRVDFVSDNISQGEVRDNAPNRRVREPNVNISKSASPVIGDAGDTMTYTLTLTNSGQSPAFDVNVIDIISDPNITLVSGTVTTSAGVVSDGNDPGDTNVSVNIPNINRTGQTGDVVIISFDVVIDAAVTTGTIINNTASVTTYNSIPGGGRIYPQVNASTQISVATASATKVVLAATSTEPSAGTSGQGDGSLVDLTIGEAVTFEITATLSEGTSPAVIITDTLPDSAAGQMQLISSTVVSEGGNLSVTNSFPSAVIGPANVVSFDFGQVVNTPDGVTNSDDQIVVQIVAEVTNIPSNQGIESLTNVALIQFNGGVDTTTSAQIEVVEPIMTIDKTSSVVTGDAGDLIPVTITVNNLSANGSSATAFDVTLTDALPSEWQFAGNLQTASGLAPDTLNEVGGVINATWVNYPIGQTTEISFDVTLSGGVTPGQVTQNTAQVQWDSMPGIVTEQRSGSDNDGHSITIGDPGLLKLVTTTSEPSTGSAFNGPEDDLTIGELVTYQFTVTLPEGTTPMSFATDQLPTTGTILSVVSSQIAFVGGQITLGAGALGTPGISVDTNTDTFNDQVQWNLGDITNTPDGVANIQDQVTFEVVAVVVDIPVNQTGANDVVNNARFDFDGGTLQSTANIDTVEPLVNITKESIPEVIIADAGDTLNYRLTVSHDPGSSADSFNLQITDVLPQPGTQWINDATVISTCAGLTTDSSGEPNIVFNIPTLTLASADCTIDYQVQVTNTVTPNSSYQNIATLQYDSTPVFVAGQTRRGSSSDDASFSTSVPAMLKITTDTSVSETTNSIADPLLQDLVIGELVDYAITITLPEGTIDNAIIQDNLPLAASGTLMEVVSASIAQVGANVSSTLPGTPAITDSDIDTINDQVIFDFGTITNLPDGIVDAQDQLTVLITARLLDDVINTQGDVAVNQVTFDYFGSPGPLVDTASIDVVEPNLSFTKDMGPIVNGRVPITLVLSNTGGSAPAFDITITDVLDGSIWDLNSIAADVIPSGFIFSTLPGGGNVTVEIISDPAGSSPDNSLELNEQITFVFSAVLRTDVVLPNPVLNTATVTEINSLPSDDSNERDYSDLTDNASIGFSDLDSTKSDALLIDNNTNNQANPGDTIRYTIVVDNNGITDANGVTFSDVPDPNTSLVVGSVTTTQGVILTGNTAGDVDVAIDLGTMIAAASITITFDVIINNPLPVGVFQISNQGTIDSDEFEPIDTNDPDTGPDDDPTITPVIAEHDLTVSKDDGGITATAGSTITYSINYANSGDQNSTGVQLFETVPDNTIFNSGANPDPWVCVPGNMAGSLCTLTIGDLDGGQSGSVSFVVDVFNPKPSGIVQIINTVNIADDGLNGPEIDTTNNSDDEQTPVDAAPDLVLTKNDSISVVAPGGTVIYTLSYANIGTQDATGVTVSDVVPNNTFFDAANSSIGWTCADGSVAGTPCFFNVGNLAAGDPSQNIFYAVRLVEPLPSGVDNIINTANIFDDGNNGPDLNPGNNIDDETTPAGAVPDLFITKTDGDATSGPGGVVVYTINYGNIGTQNATGVEITETVPANSQFDSASSSIGWNCVPDGAAGSTCQFIVGNLNVGDTGSVDFAVQIDDPLPSGVNELVNTVSITDDGTNGIDPDPDNNTDTDDTGLLLEPPVGIKTGVFDSNDERLIHWTFYWFNPNNNRDLPVFIFDPIPAMTFYVPGSATCVATGNSSCTTPVFNQVLNRLELNGVIAPDEGAPFDSTVDQLNNEVVIQFSVRVNGSGGIRIENQAFANWDQDNDGDPNNDANDGQVPIPTDSPLTPLFGDPTVLGAVFAVPALSSWVMYILTLLMILLVFKQGRIPTVKNKCKVRL